MSKPHGSALPFSAIAIGTATAVMVTGQPLATRAETVARSTPIVCTESTQHIAPIKTQSAVATVPVAQKTRLDQTAPIPMPGTVETSVRALQAQVPTSASPMSEVPSMTLSGTIAPQQNPRYKFSYLGIGVNFGSGGDTSGLGEISFAAFSKFALSQSFSVRPALLVNKNTTVLLPFTYDFPISGPGHVAPYIGLGLQSSSPFSATTTKSDLLLTAGIDYPINPHLAFTAGLNLGTFNHSGIGGLLGLAYIFNTASGSESSTTSAPAPAPGITSEQTATGAAPTEKEHHFTENWNAHFQATFIYQDKPAFNARYTGKNSLLSTAENFTYSLTATGYFGVRLWQNGEFYLNPELSSGIPPSGLLGLGSLSDG